MAVSHPQLGLDQSQWPGDQTKFKRGSTLYLEPNHRLQGCYMKAFIHDSRQPNSKRLVNLNRRKAIIEKCLNCSGFEKKSRTTCVFTNCDLYMYRTGKGKQNAKARNKAVRSFCRSTCMDGTSHMVQLCTSKDCPLYAFRMTKTDRSIEIRLNN